MSGNSVADAISLVFNADAIVLPVRAGFLPQLTVAYVIAGVLTPLLYPSKKLSNTKLEAEVHDVVTKAKQRSRLGLQIEGISELRDRSGLGTRSGMHASHQTAMGPTERPRRDLSGGLC